MVRSMLDLLINDMFDKKEEEEEEDILTEVIIE